jgi:hypothetical protein
MGISIIAAASDAVRVSLLNVAGRADATPVAMTNRIKTWKTNMTGVPLPWLLRHRRPWQSTVH